MEKALLFYNVTRDLSENQKSYQHNNAIHCVLQNDQKTAVNMFMVNAQFWTPLAYKSSDLSIIALLFLNPKSLKNLCIDVISLRFKIFLLTCGN